MLTGEGDHIMRSLDLEVEGQRKRERSKWTWEKQVDEKNVKVGLKRKHFADQSGVLV